MHKILFLLLLFSYGIVPLSAQECAPTRLSVGSTGRVTPGEANNVRAQPARDADLLTTIPGGGSFTVLEVGQCVDGLLWVQIDAAGVTGWTVENANGEYWLEPLDSLTGDSACITNIAIGETGEVINMSWLEIYSGMNSGSVVGTIDNAQTFTVTGQAVCHDGIEWLPIMAEGVTGWINARGYSLCEICSSIIPFVRRPMPAMPTSVPNERIVTPISLPENAITPVNATQVTTHQILGDGYIANYAWKPDESAIAVAGSLEIRIVNPQQMNLEPLVLTAHESVISGITYTPNGEYLVSADANGVIIFWDAENYTLAHILELESAISSMVFSPNANYLAVSTHETGVALWSLENEPVLEVAFQTRPRASLQFTPDSSTLLSFTDNGFDVMGVGSRSIRYSESFPFNYNIADWELQPDGHSVTVLISEIIGDFTHSFFHYIWVWDIESGQEYSIADTLSDGNVRYPQFDIAYAPDNSMYILNIGDEQQFWGIPQGTSRTLNTLDVLEVVFSPDSRLVAFSTETGALHLYAETNYLATLYGISGRAFNVQFSPSGRYVAAQGADSTLRVWEVETLQRLGTLTFKRFNQEFYLTSDEQMLYSDGDLWDVNSGSILLDNFEVEATYNRVVFNEQNQWIAVDLHNEPPVIRSMTTGEILQELPLDVEPYPAPLSQDGNLGVFVLNHDDETRSIMVWNLITGEEVLLLDRYYENIDEIMLSPDSSLLLVQGGYHSDQGAGVDVWDVNSGVLVVTAERITYIKAISRDNSAIVLEASSDTDETEQRELRIYHWLTDEIVTIALETGGPEVAVNPNGTVIAVGQNDGEVCLYDAQTGEYLTSLAGHAGRVTQMQFSMDGTTLFTSSTDGTMRIWRVNE